MDRIEVDLKGFSLGEQEGSEPFLSEEVSSLSEEAAENAAGVGKGKKKGQKKKAAKGEVRL